MKIPEEVSQDGIQHLLDKLPLNLTPIERVLLCNDGTNQTLLSVLFQMPIKVEVLSQPDFAPYKVIIRWTKLVAEYSDDNKATVCLAESVIPLESNSEWLITAIGQKQLGIGQILKEMNKSYERRIIGLYADENVVARNYRIIGEGIDFVITETFPRQALKKAEGMK